LLFHKSGEAKHLAKLGRVSNRYRQLLAEGYRIHALQFISVHEDLEVKHCALALRARRGMDRCFDVIDHKRSWSVDIYPRARRVVGQIVRPTLAFSCGARSAFKLKEQGYLRNMLSRRQLQGFVGQSRHGNTDL
jgi:hypothetical protein